MTLQKNGGVLTSAGVADDNFPLFFLGYRVLLEDGYRFRSFFKMLERYAHLAGCNAFFPEYLRQYRDCPDASCCDASLDCLELGKTVEMIGFPGKPRMEIYSTFTGIAGGKPCEIKTVGLESLLDMPMALGKLRHVVFGDRVDVFEFETVYTMFELIDGIAWELSFHFTPGQCEIRR
ncbi:MAG: hypothetical protein JRH15_07905 [Deltaproteobacteria bacterium]|nr:hypothetical protein [Deltaproteobacteria bacterium]